MYPEVIRFTFAVARKWSSHVMNIVSSHKCLYLYLAIARDLIGAHRDRRERRN